MISKTSNSECYVYITLPGQTEAVTAGRFELTLDRGGSPLGRFVYGQSYQKRSDAVDIDPVDLKLGRGTFDTTSLKGVFGALRDAGPDYWGRRLIERHVGGQLGELDYLLHSPDDRAGALGFGLGMAPPAPLRKFNKTIALAKLQAIADAVIKDEVLSTEAAEEQVKNLLLLGTSMGGARPKAVVEDSNGLWLAKFGRPDDRWNNERVEHVMLKLARHCGITAAESKIVSVGKRDVLLVKRFDREKTVGGYTRSRMVSGLTLLRTEDTVQSRNKWSYIGLVEELRRVSATPKKDAAELFRRMCFNALISNTDDHPRNHAIIAWDRDWKLSPAYDLTPTNLISLERRDLAMTCGDDGRIATAVNLQSQCSRFLLNESEAKAIIKKMAKAIEQGWYDLARAEGVSVKDCEQIRGAFVYPGFWAGES
ncbi:MAG: HipA domain-containing protein [Alphaproteobacteria bacterium]